MKYYELRSRSYGISKPNMIVKEVVVLLKSQHLNYEEAKKTLDDANQVLLNYLLDDTKL